ncbi:MAG: SMP-30/gluconolactonase/LRE family protein [Desulfobacteraceae bacterium]|nr:SMP-30/gluconolactonase/LRE family protein [Desulfobacteraceae bacterium]
MNTKKMNLLNFFLLVVLLFSLATGCATVKHSKANGVDVPDGQYVVKRLVDDTPFPGVNGAAIGSDGNLYVTHTGNGTITRIDLDTMEPSVFVPPYAGASIIDDIASDDSGNLYATGTTPLVGEVYRIDENGSVEVIAEGMAAPNGVEYNNRTDRLFVTECFQGNRIYEVDPQGDEPAELLVGPDVIPVPEGFDYDPDTNDLIVPDMGTGKIFRVDPDTGDISTVAENFVTPIALTIGPDKMVYIPELATGTVYKMSLDGEKRKKIAQLKPGLDNVAITDQGRLFVTNYWNATIYEVSKDGSGDFKKLFKDGPNQPLGIVVDGDKILAADSIMIRRIKNGKYLQTGLNAWASEGMPLPLSLTDGPGDQVIWTDCIHGAVAMGNPETGKVQPLAGGLDRPVAALMSPEGDRLFVAEFGAGRVTAVSLTDGSKSVLAEGLEGPLAMTVMDGTLYVAESKIGRISSVNPATGEKKVLLSSLVGKPGAIGKDGSGNLLVLDGAAGKLIRVNPQTLAVSTVAGNLPVMYSSVGSYPPVEFPLPMDVSKDGDIYLPTAQRGLLKLEKVQ